MGLSPGKIYKKCLAKAIDDRHADDVIRAMNANEDGIYYLYTRDVLKTFYGQDYPLKKAYRYLDEWEALAICYRRFWKGYDLIGFEKGASL